MILYSVSTNFCLELIGPSARGVFWTLVEREERVGERGEENITRDSSGRANDPSCLSAGWSIGLSFIIS